MKITKSSLILFFAICFGLFTSYNLTSYKFELAQLTRFEVSIDLLDGFNYGVTDKGTVLFNDELKYLTWLLFRGESINSLMSISGFSNINLYGYAVSLIYLVLGDWKPLFSIGLLFYLFFLRSLYRLGQCVFDNKIAKFMTSVFAIIPPVIDLSSGFMRDLLIISAALRVILYIIEKKYFLLFFSFALLLILRSFYAYLFLPLYYLAVTNNIKRALFFSITLWVISIPVLNVLKFGPGNLEEVSYRFIELITGFSKIIIYDFQYPLISVEAFNFYSGITYFVFVLILYIAVIVNRFKFTISFLLLFMISLSLSTFYGYTLGFFVPRTKLVFLLGIIFVVSQFFFQRKRGLFENF